MNKSRVVKNILKVYSRATDSDMSAGMSWYLTAWTIADNLHSNSNIGAGVIAAFSPMNSWKRNLELAAAAFRGQFFPGLKDPIRKAQAIINGARPLNVLRGPKVRAFYASIASGGHTDDVVIDRHAISVALGRNATEKERNGLEGKRYELFADAYRAAAIQTGLRVSDLQAITWIVWRREKGIVD